MKTSFPAASRNGHRPTPAARVETALSRLDRAAHLRPPAGWSWATLWSIVGAAVFGALWVCFAQIDEVVSAPGKLEPTGSVREVQAPVAGVIEQAYVEEGQSVRRGDPLLRLDQKVTAAQIASLESVRASLRREVDFYARQMRDDARPPAPDAAELPEELLALARDRANLVAENRLFRAQLRHSAEGIELPDDQRAFFETAEADRAARLRESALAVEQAEGQLTGSREQLVGVDRLLENNRKVLAGFNTLASKNIVSEVDRLAREGDMIRTETEVSKLRSAIASLGVEIRKDHDAAENIEVTYRKDALTGLEKNHQRIAEIDARLSKAIVDDKQRLSQIESQLTQTQASLAYQEVVAPADGVVFDLLRARQPGAVIAAGDVLLKIVPGGEDLIAKVFLPNRDIGFVRPGMPARVRVDAFPFREFGDLGGELVFIGGDALPPTQAVPFYAFPARVRLAPGERLLVRGRPVQLQSGMAVSVNLQVRRRTALRLLVDLLLRPTEKLGEIR